MIISVSMLTSGMGAATPVRVVNFSIGLSSSQVPAKRAISAPSNRKYVFSGTLAAPILS